MDTEKTSILPASLIIAAAVIVALFSTLAIGTVSGLATPAGASSPVLMSGVPGASLHALGPDLTPTPRPVVSRRSGEVQNPITHPIRPFTPQPTRPPVVSPPVIQETEHPRTPQPTVPTPVVTPTPRPTTPPATTPITTVIVTVTVPVYPSGQIYNPTYYYPPGYGYPITDYYPAGTLTVTSNPTNAIVILDGYNSGTTPFIFTGLVQGYHTLEIDYPGYEAYVTNVYVDNGANPEVDAQLVPLQTYGSMFVQTTPEGADVFVDGNYEGTSPMTVGGLSSGIHQLELHLAGYMVHTSTQDVAAGQGTQVNIAMVPYSPSTTEGSIDVTSNVPGALVYLDGTYKGAVKSGSSLNIVAVDPGSHTLLLHAPGYSDFTQTVDVSAAQVTDVAATLSYATGGTSSAPGLPGSLTVNSQPAGGQVFVDQQFRGVSPVTIYNLPPGDHIVNMKLGGYSDWSSSVTVPAGQAAQVIATFTPGGSTPVPTQAGFPIIVTGLAAGLAILAVARFRK